MSKSINRIVTILLAILMLVPFVMFASTTPAAAVREPSLISGTMVKEHYDGSSSSSTYNYWIYRPENFDIYGEKLPLIVSLHGGNGTGTNLDQLHSYDEGFCKYIYEGKTAPEAVVLMPQSPSGWWFKYSDQGEIEGCKGLLELIEYVAYNNNIDKSRIYITGVSRGGVATFLMLRHCPDYFAAAMPIASATKPALCAGIKTPIRIYHGRYDLQNDETHMGNSVITATDIINNSGGNCELIIIEGIGHSGQFVYYDTENYDAMEWLYSHRKETIVDDPLDAFKDVSASSWYANSVLYVSNNGIFSGEGKGEFRPDDNMTRAMVVQSVFNLDAAKDKVNHVVDFVDEDGQILDAGKNHTEFSDISKNDWCYTAVKWASNIGIVNGINGKFLPSRAISRQDFVTMLYRYSVLKGCVKQKTHQTSFIDSFADGDIVGSYSKDAISWAITNGIINGYNDGTLRPNMSVTRAEAAVIMERMAKFIEQSLDK